MKSSILHPFTLITRSLPCVSSDFCNGLLGEVFLQIGAVGIIRTNTIGNPGVTWDDVYLGFGDENAGLLGNSFDISSPIAEAKIVPEPAGLLLLGLAGLASRRR